MRKVVATLLTTISLALPSMADEQMSVLLDQIPRSVRTISVTGQGSTAAPPDMATINTGVTTSAPTAKQALDGNNRAMQQVMKVVKSRNIRDKDVQTSGFNVYPEYRRDPRGSVQRNEVVGYRVTNQVQVRVRNLARLGEILDALVQAGSNQISGVSFSISEPVGFTIQ